MKIKTLEFSRKSVFEDLFFNSLVDHIVHI